MNEILCALMELISKESLRFQFCHEQGFDTSCGLTVAATVLDHYWGVAVSEYEIIEKLASTFGRGVNVKLFKFLGKKSLTIPPPYNRANHATSLLGLRCDTVIFLGVGMDFFVDPMDVSTKGGCSGSSVYIEICECKGTMCICNGKSTCSCRLGHVPGACIAKSCTGVNVCAHVTSKF